jgi:hypothetical protein
LALCGTGGIYYRRGGVIVQLTDRNKILKDLAVTEAQLKQWILLGYEEATWRNSNEFEQHCLWAEQRRAFIQAELDAALVPKPERPYLAPDTPPIVSHRSGHGHSHNTQTFGEKFG